MAVQTDRRRAIRRNQASEAQSRDRLFELGFKEAKDIRWGNPGTLEISAKRLPEAIPELVGRRLARRGRRRPLPPGLRVQAEPHQRHRLVRAGRPGRLRHPVGLAARAAGRGPPRRYHDQARRRLDGHAAGRLAQEVRPADRHGRRRRRRPSLRPRAGRHARRPARLAARNPLRRRLRARSARSCTPSKASSRSKPRPTFQGTLAPLPARGPGLARLPPPASTSAASWPTTWAWARPFRCSLSCSVASRSGRPRGPA